MAEFARDEIVLNVSGETKRKSDEDILDDALSTVFDSVVVKQYYSKQRKFSDAEIQTMKDSIKEVCMNDFSDDYNLTDAEKYASEEEARIYNAVARTKRKCNNIADFIVAVRYRLDAIDYIAEHNGVYDPDKFRKLVAQGKIVLTGLTVPKYTGKDRKKINWDYISEFIADRDKDPKEFREAKRDDDFYDHVKENGGRNLFSETEYEELVEHGNCDESVQLEMVVASDKTMKKLTKRNPNITDSVVKYIHTLQKKLEQSYAFDADDAIHELNSIQALDNRSIRAYKVAPPVFHGDYASDSDWQKYEREYYKWYVSNVYVDDNGGSKMTIEEYDQMQVRKILEEAGWNIRKFSSNAKYFKSEKKKKKKAKRKEKRVRDNLLNSSARNESKKKKGKKGKKASSEKLIDDMKRRQERDLLELTGGNYSDFDEYVNEMESVDYDKIMKGRKG